MYSYFTPCYFYYYFKIYFEEFCLDFDTDSGEE